MGGKFKSGAKKLYDDEDESPITNESITDYFERVKAFYAGCQKPSKDKYKSSLMVTCVGAAVLGLTGFVVKAVSVPILHAIGF